MWVQIYVNKLYLQQNLASWRKVWYVAIAILLFDATFYVIFASGEEQYWNKIFVKDESTTATQTQYIMVSPPGQDSNVNKMDDTAFSKTEIPRAKLH